MPAKLENAQETVEQLTKLIGSFVPLFGIVGGVAGIVIEIAEKNGVDVGTLPQELEKFRAARAEVASELAAWEELKARLAAEASGETGAEGVSDDD